MCRFLQMTLRLGLTFILMYSLSGCKTSSTSNPATLAPAVVAPGYQNPADQQMGEILKAARDFYNQLQTDKTAGKFVPSATEQAALNAFAVTLNTALSEYTQYHQGAATQAQAQAAVNNVQSAQTQLQSALQPTVNPSANRI